MSSFLIPFSPPFLDSLASSHPRSQLQLCLPTGIGISIMGILAAPIEIITLIMECLELDEIFSLSLTCRQFGHLIRSQGLSRIVLQVCLSHLRIPFRPCLTSSKEGTTLARVLRGSGHR
jgi:hypothetical protein